MISHTLKKNYKWNGEKKKDFKYSCQSGRYWIEKLWNYY